LDLIHWLLLLGSQQHPESGVLLTSFSTSGTENILAEINLESMGVINGHNIFGGSKIGKPWQLCGRAHYRATRKIPSLSQILFKNLKNYILGEVSKILLSLLM
jgi:hypothetical protein